ncbi:hypothetical protein Tco_1539287 [Tanacetum coccineum]
MTTLQFADTHNLVAFLTKSTESKGFEQIVDFLNASSIRYALTVNPTIYTSCIKQLWATVKVKTINREVQLQALVDGKKISITEATVRRDVQLEDAKGIDCLSNATIFKQLSLMRYEKLSQKLTFYKAFFSPQWKFLIHTVLQCLSAKTTAWNEFSSTMASVIICLATNQKFNFSKYIFESMVKNLDNVDKFLMYPRVTPLFPTMVIQAQQEMGEGLEMPTDPHHTPIINQPSLSQPQRKQKSRRPKEKDTKIPQSSVPSDPINVADEAVNEEPSVLNDEVFAGHDMAEKEVSTADPITTAGEVVTTANVVVNTISTIPPSESITTTIPSKDNGKGIMVEEPLKMKKKDQISFDEQEAIRLQAKFDEEVRLAREKDEANVAMIEEWNDIQAKIKTNYELA